MSAQQTQAPPDAELIVQTLGGNDGAFEQLAYRHKPRVMQVAGRYARNEPELADLVQETFVKAYFALKDFRREAPFEHWLSRIALRACYDHLRRRQWRRETPLSELTDDQARWLEQAGAANSASRQEALASAKEAQELVAMVLERLGSADRMVITLLELEEKSIREVAALTGWSQTLVKVRAFRARRAMRKILESMEHE